DKKTKENSTKDKDKKPAEKPSKDDGLDRKPKAQPAVQDEKEKEKKPKEKDPVDTPLVNPEAQQLLDKLAAKIEDEDWAEALATAREVADRHAEDLVLAAEPKGPKELAKGALHVTASAALRRRLEQARATNEPRPLVEAGDRYFCLEQGALALLEAGDLYLERGNVVAAAFAWQDVLDHHPS